MAHLGSDVAAFVDGQLSAADERAAAEHLLECAHCERAVRQQRLLKSRMSTQITPDPPVELIASLTRLSALPPARQSRTERLRASVTVSISFAVVGASVVVLALAYLVGGKPYGDAVSPQFDALSTEFFTATSPTISVNLASAAPAELQAKGWSCDEKLGELRLNFAGVRRTDGVVVVSYGQGPNRLRLHEQVGTLDRESLTGFVPTTFGKQRVWRRNGEPTLLAWDRDGIVYTAATNLSNDALERALDDLPSYIDDSPMRRVGNGLRRMMGWSVFT